MMNNNREKKIEKKKMIKMPHRCQQSRGKTSPNEYAIKKQKKANAVSSVVRFASQIPSKMIRFHSRGEEQGNSWCTLPKFFRQVSFIFATHLCSDATFGCTSLRIQSLAVSIWPSKKEKNGS